jgi:hypothetical protein
VVQVLISLPVYVYYVRRMRILGTALWMCVIIVSAFIFKIWRPYEASPQAFMACAHFTLAMAFCLSSLMDNRMTSLTLPTHNVHFFLNTADHVD